jgi:hypothetical protein
MRSSTPPCDAVLALAQEGVAGVPVQNARQAATGA